MEQRVETLLRLIFTGDSRLGERVTDNEANLKDVWTTLRQLERRIGVLEVAKVIALKDIPELAQRIAALESSRLAAQTGEWIKGNGLQAADAYEKGVL